MKQHPQKRLAETTRDSDIAADGAEALARGRFKEAADIFRQLLRKEPRPEWRRSLVEAYVGRAGALAEKGMLKEAAIVLENTLEPDGAVAEPRLYLRCLIRSSQSQKAAAYALKAVGRDRLGSAEEERRFDDVAAALALLHPAQAAVPYPDKPEVARWIEIAGVARQALAAWSAGASRDDVAALLPRIPLRSAFGPVRLVLKSLLVATEDGAGARRLVAGIPADSAFLPFRTAIEALLPEDGLPLVASWGDLSLVGRAFVLETLGLPEPASRTLSHLVEAEQSGAAALFSCLQKQQDLPRPVLRSACLNLLPQLPDRVHQFDRSFTPLTAFERARIAAIAAETRGEWYAAERAWLRATEALEPPEERSAKLALGVIYRHLSQLNRDHPEIEDHYLDDDSEEERYLQEHPLLADRTAEYLERSLRADADRVTTFLELMDHYREASRTKDWGRVADEAARRFPGDSVVLTHAMQAAVARKAFRPAAGFARKLLKLDPINVMARQSMIALGLVHARKQMRAKRPDRALKELTQAAQWERQGTPVARIRIARGLVELETGDEGAPALVREGVALAGNGVKGWLAATVEAIFMGLAKSRAGFIDEEFAAARKLPPMKEEIVAVAAILASPDIAGRQKDFAGVFVRLRAWLARGAELAWSGDEFHALADIFERFDAFDLIADYAVRGLRRIANDPAFRFYRVVARVGGKSARLNSRELDELDDLASAAMARRDARFANRIQRFTGGPDPFAVLGDGPSPAADDPSPTAESLLASLLDAMFADIREPGPVYLQRLAERKGIDAALHETMRRFRKSPLAKLMGEAPAREVFASMIEEMLREKDTLRGKGRK